MLPQLSPPNGTANSGPAWTRTSQASRLMSESRGGNASSHKRVMTFNSAPACAPMASLCQAKKLPTRAALYAAQTRHSRRDRVRHSTAATDRLTPPATKTAGYDKPSASGTTAVKAQSQRVSSGFRHQRTASQSKSVETIRSPP